MCFGHSKHSCAPDACRCQHGSVSPAQTATCHAMTLLCTNSYLPKTVCACSVTCTSQFGQRHTTSAARFAQLLLKTPYTVAYTHGPVQNTGFCKFDNASQILFIPIITFPGDRQLNRGFFLVFKILLTLSGLETVVLYSVKFKDRDRNH